ncbi:2'-deoxycytidine 5'-triphosphate deaminase [Pseudosulfitobacter pseudonitzschiae]|uniref:2'-deoxycytidine 5'-triphosphate deaminase n=1 Tax=Pseudosulfitobacter pseudonitzschiae TaxID=1402135 RepID=UPI001AF9E1FE|nr:2'-deoxycytidine 5'-triphosphate deaminase [Pseudosulfitobacter pseudonitzschiae]MBM1814609.1 2'-deoxycytidine 5'-triphosphate deaminase [Pseudosulfitobacter pseudonitzschiae]MBM1831603.1 2'-deoxycytidine 5'-triphosphate deaminase [Pseudosulfitobacter pseudonitzschiae]MBM1836468.1 2'-deoxycytidine 5'-triphosphate deaminase [Pseudosulfitobacter pseudonitzschiae]MBM1841315.1 2'-deoxycytidine 5'-triphosphate deaminase [Pseudosulfitobacter pseudonitzschiae]MBM1846182.1 2'-deoxycytidine 5'-triph
MTGVIPNQQIEQMIAQGALSGDPAIIPAQIQPASLDLRLGTVAYRVRASFLAGHGAKVADRLSEFEMHRVDLSNGAVLEKGAVYVVPLMESLALPDGIQAVANAKSSTGRLDLLTRLITDGGTEFDRIAPGYTGPLYAEICPRSFSVLVRPGMRLNQIRFRDGQAVLDDAALRALHADQVLVDGDAVIDDGLGFSVDLRPADGTLVGYRAKPHTGVIDLDKIGHYDPAEYWEEVHSATGQIILDPGAFYILVSREAVHIPPDCAAEMAPYLAMVGEFRVHYAGFFDPGFGHDAAGGAGSRGVLEVRCHEAPFVLEHAQIVGRLVYEKMAEVPTQLYGAGIASNYQGQGLKLSKHFKTP